MNDFDDLEDLERELAPSLRVALHQAAAAITGEPTPEAQARSRSVAVMHHFEGADPGRGDDDTVSFLDTTRPRDIVQTSSIDAQATELLPTSTERAARHRWRTIAGVAAAVLLIVTGAVVVVARNDPTHEIQVSASARASAEEVARGFLYAYGAFDADRAMAYLTKHPLAAEWGTPAEFRLELRLLQATGWQQTIRDCTTGKLPAKAAGVTVYCRYDYSGLRSNEIGRVPYDDRYWAIVVDKGRIVSAQNRITMAPPRPFDYQVTQPFRRWVSSAYPQDAAAMYKDVTRSAWRRSEESVQLWEQHTREYVAAGTPYIARARSICSAAHDRLNNMFGPPPASESDLDAYDAAAARVLEDALAELRAVPPPEAFRDQFEQAYRLGDELVGLLRGEEPAGGPGSDYSNVRHGFGGEPGLSECTFDLPG